MFDPVPGNDGVTNTRHAIAEARRDAATAIANARTPGITRSNAEIDLYHGVWPTNFHKGIPHDCFGRPDPVAFVEFTTALSNANVAAGTYAPFNVALGPITEDGANKAANRAGPTENFEPVQRFHTVLESGEDVNVRNWESPLAGHVYDLEGPDAGDVGMAPAPTLIGGELIAEMAEVYALAILRDTPFERWGDRDTPVIVDGQALGTIGTILDDLGQLDFLDPDRIPVAGNGTATLDASEIRRREARWNDGAPLSGQSVFRGSSPGAKTGPYLSQFLLIGSGGDGGADPVTNAKDVRYLCPVAGANPQAPSGAPGGYIAYGAQRIDQRISAAAAGLDHMTDWTLWLDVQNGAAVGGTDRFEQGGKPRFLNTPRDLATYVHFDQLYQAYLNACFLLFDYKVPFDFGLPSGKGHVTRGSFATFGGPHILALLTEVSSRALKAVRRQKFQHHLRGRPEQLAAMLTLAANAPDKLGGAQGDTTNALNILLERAPNLMGMVTARNARQNAERLDPTNRIFPAGDGTGCGFEPEASRNYLLPMAFPEGSPMHAAYGAGHATVAGACVTILKAFFELSPNEVRTPGLGQPLPVDLTAQPQWWKMATFADRMRLRNVYVPPADPWSMALESSGEWRPAQLTIEGELNKLAANISIGRNMAGVHFYTDYFDSLRMGERIAVGILQEQMTNYNDPCSMRLPSFDGDRIVISTRGTGDAQLDVLDGNADEWWSRHLPGNAFA